VLEEIASLGRKLDGSIKSEPGRRSGSPLGKDVKVTMPVSATKPQAVRFEDDGKGKEPKRSADFDFDVSVSKFREAANTVLLGEIEKLKKCSSDEGRRFELKKRVTALGLDLKGTETAPTY
jgi:hypothetical protein